MRKICNQTFIKDSFRDRNHKSTVKCMVCNEESHWDEPFPFEMIKYVNWLESFEKLHTKKGCNKKRFNGTPAWASTEFSIGIAME